MIRYPAFDPPEYRDWAPDADAQAEFAARLEEDPARTGIVRGIGPDRHRALYAGLLRNRLHDIALKRWVMQGVISKAWLGTGEEAATVGICACLGPGDHVGPMIRNAGACHEMGMPVADMLRAYLATADTLTRGRDLHTGDPAKGIIPPISMVAALVPVFSGIALAFRLKGLPHVAVTWIGDGATRTQDFHEGATFAAARSLPVVFVIQDNAIALGTPKPVGVAGELKRLHEAYGAAGFACDGNNVLDVFAASTQAVARARGAGPVFLHTRTFRMGGHATHDEAEARQAFAPDVFAHWGRRDPVGMYETWLREQGPRLDPRRSNTDVLVEIEASVIADIDAAAEQALQSRAGAVPAPATLSEGVHAG